MYNDNQIKAIIDELKKKYKRKKVKPVEVVITLIYMERQGDISEEMIKPILFNVFEDKITVLTALLQARNILSKELINSIESELK